MTNMNLLNTLFYGLLVATLLSACAVQPTETPSPTSLPAPTNTAEATSTPSPTAAPLFVDLKEGGFSLNIQAELEFDVDDVSVNISDKQGMFVISLNGRPYIASEYTLESFLGKYLAEMEGRGGTFELGDPYEIVIDEMSGLAIDLTGNFLGSPIEGKGIIVSPQKDFIVFGLGMSNLGGNKDAWAETGSVIFEDIIASIRFKEDVKP